MTRSRKIALAFVVAIVGVVAWGAVRLLNQLSQIPDAYAAWDTGTLLTEYMKQNADRWPQSWDEVVEVVRSDSQRQIVLRGAQAGDLAYAQSLRSRVKVDWTYDPLDPKGADPVTKANGSKFGVIWSGAEPNDMIREYLADRAATRPTVAH